MTTGLAYIVGPVGPIGPTGAAGATILDSYDSYAALIAAHPTGTAGDAYLAGGVLYVWDAITGTWKSMGSLVGPTGAAGATILDSYDSYAEFIQAHATGTAGDAYLVAGELYVWDGEAGEWVNMGSLIGPTGPTGAAGATILDSYDSYVEFIQAHETGTAGDAYLVEGDLYVWDGEAGEWVNMGSLIGPTGAAGATILDSYATYEDFISVHETGTAGDAYLVGGDLYVWDGVAGEWVNMGSLIGPTGPTGLQGENGVDGIIGEIAGVVATADDLPTTGVEQGAIFYVEEDDGVYVWDETLGEWTMVNLATGPRGATGPTGPTGPTGADGIMGPIEGVVATQADLPATGAQQGSLYYVEEDGGLYVWDETLGEWTMVNLAQGPRGVDGPTGPTGPAGTQAAAIAIIPFASQQAPFVRADASGTPTNTALIGFGYMEYSDTVIGDAHVAMNIDTNDGSFSLSPNANRQVAFSLPYAMKLESIYATVGNFDVFPLPPTGTLVFPYVQVYAAVPGTNTFFPLPDAFAKPETGIDPQSAQAATMRAASKSGLSIELAAGTRIAIGGMMEITGDTLAREYYLYFTGGIGLSRWVE